MNTNIQKLVDEIDEVMPLFIREMQRFLSDVPEFQHITPPQAYLMRQLYMHGSCNASTVGKILGVTSGPVTSITNRLIKNGYVVRRQNEEDRRVMEFGLTEKGEEILLSLIRHRKEKILKLFEKLGEERSLQLVRIFEEGTNYLKNLD